jgi:ATP-binding cassette subfamily B protein
MFRALARLLPYLGRVRRPILSGLAAVLVATAISLISPWVLKLVVDDLTDPARAVDRGRLALYAATLVGLAAADGGFRYLMRTLLIGASRQVEYDLRNDFFGHLERLPVAWFQARRTGDLMSRATNDLSAVRQMVGPAVMYFTSTALGFIIAVGLMIWIDARLTLLALLPLPAVTVATRYFGRAIHDRFERIQDQLAGMSAVVQEALSGVRVVRAYGREPYEEARFRAANDEYVARNRGLIRLQSAFYPSLSLCFGLSAMLVIWVGGRDVVNGRLSLGEFVAFSRYLVLLAWPLIAFGWVINILQRGVASLERMGEVLDATPVAPHGSDSPVIGQWPTAKGQRADGPPVIGQWPTAKGQRADGPHVIGQGPMANGQPAVGRVEVKGLTFTYPTGAAPALHDVSFSVEPGRTVAIVGPTGSGKSTIVALLARLHDPPRGTMFVDGVDVLDWPLGALRAAIAMVPQEPFLFSDSVADNIAFGLGETPALKDRPTTPALKDRPTLPALKDRPRLPALKDRPTLPALKDRPTTIVEAARVAGLDADIAEFPHGYDTLIGERGITLSGGQKQRLAIARAVAVDPRILILDDALSAVDTGTEERILEALRGVRRTRATIVIAHRVSTVRDADEILVLLGGRVVERGTHVALAAAGGEYARMHERQLLEREIEIA